MPDWQKVRALFPALSEWTFLNTATLGQISTRSTHAMEQYFRRRDETAATELLLWFDDADRLRGKVARLINASADDIAFLPNSSAALALLMNGIDWRHGDEVLTLEDEFPNQFYAPLQRGVGLREVPAAALLDSLTDRTRLVALSAVNYTTGVRAPLEIIAPELRRRGIPLYVDGTQMVGALRFDFGAIQPDLLAVNCYKWMLAPNGVAFMAVHPNLRERLQPLNVGWRSDSGWRDFANLRHGKPELKRSAEKYEGGMLAFSLLYGLESSVDLMLELTPEAIERRVLALANETRRLFPTALPYEDTPITSVAVEGAEELAKRLAGQRILVSARQGRLRVSTHFYNNEEDLEMLARAAAV
jgi:cysteine desulfurase / selenocysteine lyase